VTILKHCNRWYFDEAVERLSLCHPRIWRTVVRVFISYDFEDKSKFDDICFAFENSDIVPWKTDEIAAGEVLRDRLRHAIETCAVCVFVATRKSLASGWCQAEIGAFWGAAKPVVMYLPSEELRAEELPKQFQADKWAVTTREVVESVKVHLRKAAQPPVMGKRAGNVFWLGHDLARAIRIAKFEAGDGSDLVWHLTHALHHLGQIELSATNARRLLLGAVKASRNMANLSVEQRSELADMIRRAKNDLGGAIADSQQGFKGHPTIDDQDRLEQEIEAL
jgi:hypothetical protein